MRPLVWVLFNGFYMNLDVLREADITPHDWEVATLSGFDLRIAPRANLIRTVDSVVYGILATATQAELDRLYTNHAKGVLGETYLPEATVAVNSKARSKPALTYIAPTMDERPADLDYAGRIAKPAAELGFPEECVARIRAFATLSARSSSTSRPSMQISVGIT